MVGRMVDLLPMALEEDVMDGFLVDREDVVALIEDAARSLTGGDKMEAVALAMRRLLESTGRTGTLFGRHPCSARYAEGVDPFASALDEPNDAETGAEIER